MKINKKSIISSIVLISSIAISAVSSYSFKATADEETLAQVKMQLQEQIDEKAKELEDKDKQLEDLNNKVEEQKSTIDKLSSSINNLNEGLNNTNAALDTAKKVQAQDKVEVTNHSDNGDSKLQEQIDLQKAKNEAAEENRKKLLEKAGECSPDPEKENK